jgi:hypothetical protein
MEHAFHRKRGKFKPAGAAAGGSSEPAKPRCDADVAIQSQSLPTPIGIAA